MSETFRIKKYTTDKVAFLGLLIISLIIAQLISVSRSAIVLCEPIILKHTGLAISVPSGNGWQSGKNWQFQNNSFVLASIFAFDSENPTTLVRCRYILAGVKDEPDVQFTRQASDAKGRIVKTEQKSIDGLIVDWAHINKESMGLEIFSGIVKLPDNRQLRIEVHQATGNVKLAEKVFNLVIESLKFEDNSLLKAGNQIVKEVKDIGISNFLYAQTTRSYFLIKDTKKEAIGFLMESVANLGQNNELNIVADNYVYVRRQYPQEETSLLQCTNNFDEFFWKSETSNITGISSSEVSLKENGKISIVKFGPRPDKKNYSINPAALPDSFLNFALSQIIDSHHEKFIIDTIEPDGTISPVFVSKGKTPLNTGYMLEIEFLNNSKISQQMFLDNKKEVSRILFRQDGVYTIERANKEDILREFPQRADYILQKEKI